MASAALPRVLCCEPRHRALVEVPRPGGGRGRTSSQTPPKGGSRTSPEPPATSPVIRLRSHLLERLALLNAIFQRRNIFVLEQFRHQSVFAKKCSQEESLGGCPVRGHFVIKRDGGHQGLMHLLPATFAISFDATFHVGERGDPLLKNEGQAPQLLRGTRKAGADKRNNA